MFLHMDEYTNVLFPYMYNSIKLSQSHNKTCSFKV